MTKPLVSVIVPCYNYAMYVGETLHSVLSQDYPNFELIVVDDGSTDGSVGAISEALVGWEHSSLAQRVELITQSNQGVSAALNAGLSECRGQYVATFDADDLMPPGRLTLQVEYMERHPEVGCLGGETIRIDERSAQLPKKKKRRPIRRYDFAEAFASGLVVGGNIAMYPRAVLMEVGGYDPHIRIQDFQMTLKVANAGYLIDVLPEVVTLYRKHEVSLSKNYKAEYDFGLQAIEAYRDHPAYEAAKARLITKALRLAVTDDKPYAWSLLKQVPLRHWDRQLLKRFRHLLLKKPCRTGP